MVRVRSSKSTSGQAALEFLMTYGWALMSVMIAISALIYFGVFDTKMFVKDSCQFSQNLGKCREFVADASAVDDENILIKVVNAFGRPLNITSCSATLKGLCDGPQICKIENSTGDLNDPPYLWQAYELMTIKYGCDTFTEDLLVDSFIIMNFSVCPSEISCSNRTHKIRGRLVTKSVIKE